MNKRRIRFLSICSLLAISSFTACSKYQQYINAHEPMNVDFERTYRDYVLCQCLNFGYNEPEIFKEDITLGVYNDITLFTLVHSGAGKKLDSLAKTFANNIEPSQIADHGGSKAVLSHCISYYNSDELKSAVREIIDSNAREWAKNKDPFRLKD